MKKRVLSVCLAALLSMTALSGCGANKALTDTGNSEAADFSATSDAQDSEEAASSAEPVSITYSYWIAENDTDMIERFNQVVAEFNKIYPEIEVVLETQPTSKSDDYTQKYDMLLLTGDTSTIIANTGLPQYISRASKGLFAPLDEYMEADGASMDDYRINCEYSGAVYGLPGTSTANVILLNVDALEEAGLEVPPLEWTWEEYAEYAEKLTRTVDGKKRYGSVMPFWTDPVMYYLGTALCKDDNPLFKDENTHNLDDPTLKAWLEFKNQLENIDKTEISYVDYTTGSLNYMSEFFNGNAAMVVTTIANLASARSLDTYPHEFKTAVAMLPRFMDSPVGVERDGSDVFAVSANATDAEKEAAYKFLRFMTTEGIAIMGQIPSYKMADTELVISNIVGDQEELFDVESMRAYFTWDKRTSHVPYTSPAQNNEIAAILKEEADKYLSGGQDIDETVAAMVERADIVMTQ